MIQCSMCVLPPGSTRCGAMCPDGEYACTKILGHIGDHSHCGGGIHPITAWPGSKSVRMPAEAPGGPERPRRAGTKRAAKAGTPVAAAREVVRASKRMAEHKARKLAEAGRLKAPAPEPPEAKPAPAPAEEVEFAALL